MTRRERLKVWASSLDESKIREILVECVDELIDAEVVSFYERTEHPYWDGNGERLDGVEELEEY